MYLCLFNITCIILLLIINSLSVIIQNSESSDEEDEVTAKKNTPLVKVCTVPALLSTVVNPVALSMISITIHVYVHFTCTCKCVNVLQACNNYYLHYLCQLEWDRTDLAPPTAKEIPRNKEECLCHTFFTEEA